MTAGCDAALEMRSALGEARTPRRRTRPSCRARYVVTRKVRRKAHTEQFIEWCVPATRSGRSLSGTSKRCRVHHGRMDSAHSMLIPRCRGASMHIRGTSSVPCPADVPASREMPSFEAISAAAARTLARRGTVHVPHRDIEFSKSHQPVLGFVERLDLNVLGLWRAGFERLWRAVEADGLRVDVGDDGRLLRVVFLRPAIGVGADGGAVVGIARRLDRVEAGVRPPRWTDSAPGTST